MNCLEFSKKALADPNVILPEMTLHLNACKKCSQFVKEMEAFDAKLIKVVDVVVPSEYPEKLWTKANACIQKQQWVARKVRYGLAALLILVFGVVFIMGKILFYL